MNKSDLVMKITEKTGFTKKDSEKALVAFCESIQEGVIKDGVVRLVGFGTFESVDRAARVGRNPQTGDPVNIPAKKAVKFKVSKDFKKLVMGE